MKRVQIVAALLYGVGCVIAATAPDMATLLVARLLQGIGGGMMRDILIAEVPVVLRADLYAVAALAGAAVVVIGQVLHVSSAAAMTVGALLCFGLRFMAIRYGWRLPVAVGGRRQ